MIRCVEVWSGGHVTVSHVEARSGQFRRGGHGWVMPVMVGHGAVWLSGHAVPASFI